MAEKSIKSINLLPEFLRTEKNSKFLASTIDQLIQKPQLERIDGYVGSTLTPTYVSTSDIYIPETLPLRRNYQLEPALVVKDELGTIKDVIGIDDLTNEIAIKNGNVDNFDRLYRTEFFSYDPHIDWDKFVNYQEYYWLVNGPSTVSITGTQLNSASTFSVTDNELGTSFVFSPDSFTEDPLIVLYRGNTYTFNIDSQYRFYIKTTPSLGTSDQYNDRVTNNGTSNGQITIVVDENTPSSLFYISPDQQLAQGKFVIKTIEEDSRIDVDSEIVGKVNYTSGTGIELSNGMKIRFAGYVNPESYRDKDFFVEGVGNKIRLVDYSTLEVAEALTTSYNENYDGSEYDEFPFDSFKKLPFVPEYITINRASRDLNSWSRYNRWVHKSVIETSAAANNAPVTFPNDMRARRPIIEFKPDLKLYNFGTIGIADVDLIDTVTTDAFSFVEGSAGHHIDGVLLEQGNRVIFTADTDDVVRNKIYEVNFVINDNQTRLTLMEVGVAETGSVLGVLAGTEYEGTSWWFDGDQWKFAQQHSTLNQAPLFDLFDNDGHSYDDTAYYNSNFAGNKIFSYEIGTGTNDPVLGFPLSYRNSSGVGSFLFKNHFNTDIIQVTDSLNVVTDVSTAITYCKFAEAAGDRYENVWKKAEGYRVPILEFKSTTTATTELQLTSLDDPENVDFTLEVYIENDKVRPPLYSISYVNKKCFVTFYDEIAAGSDVLFKIFTSASANSNGYYEPPIGLTNNPLNGPIGSLTLSEMSDHLHTMIHSLPGFSGAFPGNSNIRDLDNIARFGTRLVTSLNPIAFAQFFIGKKEHSVISAITLAADQYNQFKLAFLKRVSNVGEQLDPVTIVDKALAELNADKDLLTPYFLSDMVPYGTDKIVRTWTISNVNNTVYPITSDFTLDTLQLRAVLVYLNGTQLIHGTDYVFVANDSSVEILTQLTVGDNLVINDYTNTEGSFIPSTPTKLGLYPKFVPSIFTDSTYVVPTDVIQGHDGSITKAYGDYRDDVILELEKRIYNNIKTEYKHELLDVNSVIPGAFRENKYSQADLNKIIQKDFIKWTGQYGVDAKTNSSFDEDFPFTWNYTSSYSEALEIGLTGSWRAVYNYFYDTDRPHSHPWEMLGFSEQPSWWEDQYGPAPYTAGNEMLWEDIEAGRIQQGNRTGIDPLYVRPGLIDLLPVDDSGDLVDPTTLLINITPFSRRQDWTFGDQSPAETAWRRSSFWPFVVQKMLALTVPASYSALMYDTSRVTKNIAGQWTYGSDNTLLNLKNVLVHSDNRTLTSGYSVYVVEAGQARTRSYIDELKSDLSYIDFNLFYKVGGFISKEKLQIVIDAIDPTSTSPGALLPQEDYELILNVSNPVKSTSISGVIIQRANGKYIVKGYDTSNPYFTVYEPIRTSTTPAITVGGLSENYVKWAPSNTGYGTGLTAADTTTASASATGMFYQQGMIVQYQGTFYRVKINHRSEATFNPEYFQSMPYLPINGGASVQICERFSAVPIQVAYGTEFDRIQQVYDLLLGYGAWLGDQGFVFDDFNTDLQTVINWEFTGKEFLYWTTQNWANNSVITLSPFAERIKFQFKNSVVDDIFNSFYDYSILQANGVSMPQENISVNREDGVCTITSNNTTDGIYFAVINSIQKEHAMVFNNSTMFNDTIYDIETGYRQRRMKLLGFRTANWDGDFFSPGFVYDTAIIDSWKTYTDYRSGDIVKFNGKYYAANGNVAGSDKFNFGSWNVLGKKPIAQLLPNFDYKISQFEDFYSLDIDNFDSAQQKMAQHLIGYTPRVYLNNIFTNPITQYKFYQGFIKEKGTRNAISRLAKASIHNLQGEIDFTEEWAFRVGHYGSYETFKEIEIPLTEGMFAENPQIINVVDTAPTLPNDLIYYSTPSDLVIKPSYFESTMTFITTSSQDVLKLDTAGYVMFDDVDSTAFNENTILDIADNRGLKEDSLTWLGFKPNGDWDVLRYKLIPTRLISAYMDDTTVGVMVFVTKGIHNLSVGDIVSVSQFDTTADGVYRVASVPKLNQFTVSLPTTISIPDIQPEVPGLLFKFTTSRFDSFDSLPNDYELLKLADNTKVWIDNDGNGNWVVYEKIKNYNDFSVNSSTNPDDQKLGWKVNKNRGSDIVMVSAPGYVDANNTGSVFVYNETAGAVTFKFRYGINSTGTVYHAPCGDTGFGQSLAYDERLFNSTSTGLLFVGAPNVGYTKSATATTGVVRYANTTSAASTRVEEGLVKISSISTTTNVEYGERVLLSPYPVSYEQFGYSLYQDKGLLLVGAPSTPFSGTGTVYSYQVSTASNTVSLTYNTAYRAPLVSSTGTEWGHAISGSDGVVVISAPGWNTSTGYISVFTGTSTATYQTIISPFGKFSKFGEDVKVSPDGDYIFVAAPNARNTDQSYGKVAVYKVNAQGTYTFLQTLVNPVERVGMKFGQSIDVNSNSTELVVSAVGVNRHIPTTFDKYSELLGTTEYVNDPDSLESESATTFDSGSTTFFDSVVYSGTAYVYNRKNSLFRIAGELKPVDANTGTNFGYSVAMNDNAIYIGAPAYKNKTLPDSARSAFYQFYKADTAATSWNLLREQGDYVEVDTLQKVSLIDSFNEEVVEYLDVIDPVKGKIVGIADADLKFKSAVDPAVYSLGTTSTLVDLTTNWIDDHVGELWWDLSTVKYVIYEQGNLTYRKNNWGTTFPGSSIDVYEWVGSSLLPSEWNSLADTPEGLNDGISGTPKYPDNSVLSVKQIYNSVSGTFVNYYYYWVKNKVLVPSVKNRRISANQVAALIRDPAQYGVKYASVLSKDAIAVANIGDMLVDNRINLNVTSDEINNSIPRHTEWLLLQEGSATSVPNSLLEKKLIDSLIGYDSLGNVVPDPGLSPRERYGISIRPRQTLFKNRNEALRNLVEFTNSVLINERITGYYNFANLNAKEEIPDEFSHEYDVIFEDNEGLLIVDTRQFTTAQLACTVDNGRIRSVSIVDPGFGYRISPTVTINNNLGAVIKTTIDELGRIIDTTIENAGNGFTSAPTLEVRPFTAVIKADATANGKWTKFVFNTTTSKWVSSHTQDYNTTLYWNYTDWISSDYNKNLDFSYTINELSELVTLDSIVKGQYVKVKNAGLGYFIILEKATDGVYGTFGDGYNIVYSEKGTIQFNDSVWSTTTSLINELGYIFTALKEDIFINELKINWNLFFFKAVKYALSEQKLLDWAFKTSFINVVNYAGSLDQRSIYKLQNSEYYEDYLKEVKPYHTKIRNFTTNYTVLEPSRTYTTDFDLPATFDTELDKYVTVNEGDALLDSYPWKAWADNYTFGVGSVSISNPGAGYTLTPTVIFADPDQEGGVTATGKAYIRSGSVYEIEVTNSGRGYTKAPDVFLINGGDGVTTTAIAYANLSNNKVRSTTVGMRFDRTTRTPESDTLSVVDRFVCNGSDTEFTLNWLAVPDKSLFTVTLDGVLVLSGDYTVEYFDDFYNYGEEYSKKYNKIVFLNFAPTDGQVLRVSYTKNINLLNATDRILNYYTATTGMPGLVLDQLMDGIVYPKTRVEGLMFDYTTKWDPINAPFGETSWADEVNFYTSTTSTASSTLVGSTWTSLALASVTGVAVNQYANVISTTTNAFTTSTVKVVSVNTISNTVVLNAPTINTLATGTEIEFWTYDANISILDSAIDGGTWNTATRITALGINPEDITIDGSGFITADSSYAPEELVPGEVHDSIGINVYTKTPEGSPVVVSSYFEIVADTTATKRMSIIPPNSSAVQVVCNDQILDYVTITNFTSTITNEFTINWVTNELIIPPQTLGGKVGYTIISIGGGRPDTEAGVIDSAQIIITTNNSIDNNTSTQVQSLSGTSTVKSAYVTLNGETYTDYILTYANEDSNRAAVNVHNLPDGENVVNAWFFGTAQKNFNEIREETFTITNTSQVTFNLSMPAGVMEPAVGQVLVEMTDSDGRYMLRPPHIDYYEITNTLQKTYLINNNSFHDLTNVRAYINGTELRRGFEFSVAHNNITDVTTVTILIPLFLRDVLALVSTPVDVDYDFDIIGSTLVLTNNAIVASGQLKVITYNNHDDMLMRTERFDGSPSRRYMISRPVIDENYIWVTVNGIPLISGYDYELLEDQRTIQLSDEFETTSSDTVVIRSIRDNKISATVLGYRIFNDIFNRTHFKRLSKQSSTYLTRPLYLADTEIYVADASVLTPPIVSKNIPGVIIVDAERIEFFKIEGNVLSQLRRSTLGTAPSLFCQEYSKVIDQGTDQTVPFTERISRQDQLTEVGVNTYDIPVVDHSLYTGTFNQFNNDAIVLTTSVDPKDQLSVYYGGRPLRKVGTYYQDITVSYDSPEADLTAVGTTSTAALLPGTAEYGTSYVVTTTNQVWVYTGSKEVSAVNGFVYHGLNYLPAEFSVNTSTNEITLNIQDGVQEGVKLTIVKREFDRADVWNTEVSSASTLSLLDSDTVPAKFLQTQPAELPDNYYYGGDTAITNVAGIALTDNENSPLEGI